MASPGIAKGLRPAARFPRGRAAWLATVAVAAGALPLLAPAVAHAASGQGESGPSEALLLAQILALVVLARLLGEAMLWMKQPAVMGHLLAGIVLGPSLLGWVWPSAEHTLFPNDPAQKAMLSGIAQFGILMLLLLAGMETDLALVRRVKRAAISASAAGIALPFVAGVLLGLFLPASLLPDPEKRLVVCLFLGTALSISSVKIVATVVRDMGFLRRDVGQVILASAIVDDTIGWIIIAITLSLASHGSLDWAAVGRSTFGTAAFLVLSFTFGRQIVFRLIRVTNDFGRGEAPVVATIVVIMGAMALLTSVIGVHTVLGAFVAGILVGESPILTREIDEQLRGLTAGLFMPVFFGLSGLSADLTVLRDPHLALLTLLLIAIASIGKAAGAFTGASLGGLGLPQSLALAAGMNARGSTEIIVASIGLSIGVLSHDLFTMIVAMAFITTVAMPPTLRWALARLPVDKAEQKRLDREEVAARGLLSQWERILVVTDDSASGKFAARIAGLLAGQRGMPVTVLKAAYETAEQAPASAGGESSSSADIVKAAAAAPDKDPEQPARPVDVVERQHDAPWEDAIAAEAKKGYDLMVIGVSPTAGRNGGFDEHVSRLAQSFPGSLAIISARGRHEIDPTDSGLKMLVPVTGSEVSRHGAELALALAKAAGGVITALTVVPPEEVTTRERLGNSRILDAAEIAKEITVVADAMEQPVQIARRTDISAEDAILREARRGRHDVILLGVSRRPGERLSFGDIASALVEAADRSLIFVAFEGMARQTTRKSDEGGAA